jgi:hypothetical protein
MPSLNFPVSQAGLTVPVLVGLDGQATTALHAAGQTIPPPVLARGLLDIGSNATSVAPWILRKLGLGSGAVGLTQSASGIVKVFIHHVSIGILDPNQPGSPEMTLPTVLVSELPTVLPDADVLIGLNVLLECKLTLDGPQQVFSLEF